VAWVTGSARRLGREIALRLADRGYFVFIHYNASASEAGAVLAQVEKRGGRGALLRGDLGSPRDIARLAAEVKRKAGRLDLLVNNVGLYKPGPLLRYAPEDFERTLQVNLSAVFRLIQAVTPLFPRAGGAIVNIGYAGVENLSGTVHNTAYLISKTGLLILTKSLAQALGPRGVRVNMVSPGILSNSVELPRRAADLVPLGRLGGVGEVADAVEFLAGEKAGYITGANLDVSGGYHLALKSLEGNARGIRKGSKR
jgi:NAD(P)-dependent dehydrogenase (short-subunit alcohol dehydrogenase family)